MRFPTLATTSPVRAWLIGLGLALVITEVPFIAAPLTQIAIGWYVLPLGFAIVAGYALTVCPRAFAASGALLGLLPFVTWGVIDGLERCASFNRRGPSGSCEADPSMQLVIVAAVYVLALLTTGIAASSSRYARRK